VPGCQKLQMTA